MNFDIRSAEFWDPEATRKEITRVFDTCHGCRVCYTLCPSFVKLFEVTDDNAGVFGQVETLTEKEINSVVDLCYQCKICDPICPYTPPHALDIDFPRTLIRYSLVRKKQEGTTFADRIFGNTDLVGRLASYAAPLVNWANRNRFLRGQLEKKLPLEVSVRLQRLVDKHDPANIEPGRLREIRALEILEHLATPEARQVLQELAKGAPTSRRTQDAIAALRRFDRLANSEARNAISETNPKLKVPMD